MSRIPADLGSTQTTTVASNATFVQFKLVGAVPSIEVQRGDLRFRTNIRPDAAATAKLAGGIAERAVVWNVLQQTERADTGDVISASTSKIALDRTSGAAADWSGQCLASTQEEPCTDGNVKYAGQLYQFPFDTQKKTYQFYDSDLRKTLPISYSGTDTVRGVAAYRFSQVVPEQPLQASPMVLGALVGRFAPGAKSATMMYSTRRTIWVEPVTGVIVSVKEQQHRTLVPDAGSPTVLLDATFQFDPQTQRSIADDAAHGSLMIRSARLYLPIGLGVLGILALVLGYWIIRRRRATA
jgi:hypothetical protein